MGAGFSHPSEGAGHRAARTQGDARLPVSEALLLPNPFAGRSPTVQY